MASSYEKIMKTKPYLPLNMGGSLTEAMVVKAQRELGETEEVKAKTIPELRRLVQQTGPGFVGPTDDAYLLMYLRARKFNVKKAFLLLENFYKVKTSNDDLFGSFDQEAVKTVYDKKIGYMLPYRDEEGCGIVIIKMRNWDVDMVSASQCIIALTAGGLMSAHEPATQICGIRLLVDVEGASLKQIRSLIPRHVKLLAKAFTNCVPLRFKAFHIYNESPIFQYMVSFLKLFLTEKIKKRIYLHGDNQKELHQVIPKAILPAEDFGGDNPDDVTACFRAEMEKFYEVCREISTYGYRQ